MTAVDGVTIAAERYAKDDAMQLVRNHSHWGAFFAEVEDGRIVGVRPFERDPDPSHLINAIPDGVHSKSRIAQPMVREGWLKHGPGHGEGRGREPFVPVSWDKALDLVAGEIERVRREHGSRRSWAARRAGRRPACSTRRGCSFTVSSRPAAASPIR